MAGQLNLYSRWSAIPETTHYHVDFAIPWSDFTSHTGVDDIEQIRAVLSTSTSHTTPNKDAPLGSDFTDQISNVLSDNVPEPAVVTLLLGAGGGLLAFRRIFRSDPESAENGSESSFA